MTDDEFIDGAIELLPADVKRAAAACLAAQKMSDKRITPREIKDVCKALGLTGPNRTAVLALLGWVYSPESRQNRHVFWDLFTQRVNPKRLARPSGNKALALGIMRTLFKGFTQHN